jgi:hypothetical protein
MSTKSIELADSIAEAGRIVGDVKDGKPTAEQARQILAALTKVAELQGQINAERHESDRRRAAAQATRTGGPTASGGLRPQDKIFNQAWQHPSGVRASGRLT